MYSFYFPQAAWLILFLIPIMIGFLFLNYFRSLQLNHFANPLLIADLLTPRSQSILLTKQIGWGFIWILCCIALMDPIGNIHYVSTSSTDKNLMTQQLPQEVIFLIDTSASMNVKDGSKDETRLEEGKRIIIDVVRQLSGQNTSLYAFTSILTPIVPPTLDYLFLRLSVGELHIDQGDIGGTNFAKILQSLKEEIFSQPSFQHYSIILLSDGEDREFENLSSEEKNKQIETIIKQLPESHSQSFNFYTVGLGRTSPSPIPFAFVEGKPVLSKLDSDVLIRLAQSWNGTYYEASNWNSLNLAKDIKNKITENLKMKKNEKLISNTLMINPEDIKYDVYYQIPLALGVLFYILNLLLPDVRRKS
ncbi:MAG: VWA domain-containing protein [Parachlamydiaceae bacterium]|nr:VWA domain-containing protein [Parachlamydiaceae bacterium]